MLRKVAPIVAPVHMSQFMAEHMLQFDVVFLLVHFRGEENDRPEKSQNDRRAMQMRNAQSDVPARRHGSAEPFKKSAQARAGRDGVGFGAKDFADAPGDESETNARQRNPGGKEGQRGPSWQIDRAVETSRESEQF